MVDVKRDARNQDASCKHLSDIVGDWGLWQANIALCAISSCAFSAFNALTASFYAPPVAFTCRDIAIPDNSDQCSFNGTACSAFSYNDSQFGRTAVQEWDLVCDRSYLSSFSQSIFLTGIVFSAVTFGYLSDEFGRKPVVLATAVIEILSGILSASSNSMWLFVISRFLLACGMTGRILTAFLMMVETVSTKYRALMGIAFQLGWAVGYVMLPAMAFLLKDFRHLLLAVSVPEILWLFWFWQLPESPRWLLAKERFEEAFEVIRKAVHMNGISGFDVRQRFDCFKKNMDREKDSADSSNPRFMHLWGSWSLAAITLIFYFAWFTNSFIYYGISLNVGDLAGDYYWNFFWVGLVEFPSYFFCMAAMRWIGRRPLLVVMMFGSGISCLTIVPFYLTGNSASVWIRVLALIGKFCITSSFAIIYIYSAEVYPTALRQIGVGTCSLVGHIGSVAAPFMKELSQYTDFGFTMTVFGVLSLLTGILCWKLPETKDREIPDSIRDMTRLRNHQKNSQPELAITSNRSYDSI